MLESNGLLSPISTELSLPSSVFTETTRFGRSSPYCVGSASLSSLFCLKSATPFTTASTVDASVSAATGSTIFHGAEASARVTSATSFPPLTSLTWRTLALSSSSNSFADFSFCSAFFSVSRVTQRAAPPIAAASARTPSVVTSDFVVCFMAGLPGLAGLPDEQAREEQRERQQVEGEQRHLVLLLGGEEQVVPAAAPGPDGDLRLLVRHPARRVQREVAVPAQLVEPVGGELRGFVIGWSAYSCAIANSGCCDSVSITSSSPSFRPHAAKAFSRPEWMLGSIRAMSFPPLSTHSCTSFASPSVSEATGPARTSACASAGIALVAASSISATW